MSDQFLLTLMGTGTKLYLLEGGVSRYWWAYVKIVTVDKKCLGGSRYFDAMQIL